MGTSHQQAEITYAGRKNKEHDNKLTNSSYQFSLPSQIKFTLGFESVNHQAYHSEIITETITYCR